MPESNFTSIAVSKKVLSELKRRKKVLSDRMGRAVSYDEVLRASFGWRV